MEHQCARLAGGSQLNVHVRPDLLVGGGYGFDDPDGADLDPVTGRRFNRTWELHCHFHAAPLVLRLNTEGSKPFIPTPSTIYKQQTT